MHFNKKHTEMKNLLKISAVLWIIWGLVHILAGVMTMKGILTGDIAPTSGEVYVAGNDMSGSVPGGVAAARQNIGFCPQQDP